MPWVAMNANPTDVENLRVPWGTSGGHDLAALGIGGLGDTHTKADAEAYFTQINNKGGTMYAPVEMSSVRGMIDQGHFDAAWVNLRAVENVISKKQAAAAAGGSGSSTTDLVSATSKAVTDIANAFTGKPAPSATPGGGGGGKVQTDWGKWALIGGGVMIAGVAVIAITRGHSAPVKHRRRKPSTYRTRKSKRSRR